MTKGLMIMNKLVIYYILPILLFAGDLSAQCLITLNDGNKVEAESCWQEGDEVKYLKYGGTLGIKRTRVASFKNSESVAPTTVDK